MAGDMPKDDRKLMRAARRAGWRVVRGTKHWKWYSPEGELRHVTPVHITRGRQAPHLRDMLRKEGVTV